MAELEQEVMGMMRWMTWTDCGGGVHMFAKDCSSWPCEVVLEGEESLDGVKTVEQAGGMGR